ncbi:MAG: CotH kinase family protein, partial [Prevotella sp.]|nr:CotH kinase family protein [Prevotella sp.]
VDGSYESSKKNYEHDWRRPINLEFFEEANATSKLNQLCETRVMGGASRGAALKSLAIYANKRFGTKRFAYEFFPDQRQRLTDYKSLALRNAGNDFDYLYMRDAIIQRTMASHVDLDWQAWRPAIVYINGTYRGILNIRERSNEDNIYTNYNGLEDIDMFENWNELKEGDWDHYNAFKAFYAEHGHTLAEYEQWIDWEEFINLMAMNLYYNNQDFPGNNIVMWRPRTANGRWRFIAKDTDFGLGLYGSSATYKTLEWLYNPNYDQNRNWANQYEHTRLFRRMMEDADFHREFIDRTAIYMGDFMNSEGTRAVWDPMYEEIKAEYPNHRRLFNQWWPNYDQELSTARQWIATRTNSFYQQMADFYKLGTPTLLTVNKELTDEERASVSTSINGIRLSRGKFDGKFFAGRALTLDGTFADGATGESPTITGWQVRQINSDGSTTTTDVPSPHYSFTMPACSRLIINAVLGTADGISTPTDDSSLSWRTADGQLIADHLAPGTVVSLSDMRGILVGQAVASGRTVALPLPRHGLYVLRVGAKSVKVVLD